MSYSYTLYLCCRGIAKASQKQKLGGSSKDLKAAKTEKQPADISEALTQDPEEPVNDPPPSIDATITERMDIELNPSASHDPLSPKSPTSPRPAEEIPPQKDSDDMTITGTAHTVPGVSTVLTKHSIKEESSSLERGKAKLDLESYVAFSASEIHAGYLNHLHTSRDLEAGLVNLMKERYEVWY